MSLLWVSNVILPKQNTKCGYAGPTTQIFADVSRTLNRLQNGSCEIQHCDRATLQNRTHTSLLNTTHGRMQRCTVALHLQRYGGRASNAKKLAIRLRRPNGMVSAHPLRRMPNAFTLRAKINGPRSKTYVSAASADVVSNSSCQGTDGWKPDVPCLVCIASVHCNAGETARLSLPSIIFAELESGVWG